MQKKYSITFRKKLSEVSEKKFIHIQVGKGYENEAGTIDLVINAIPIGDWDGRLRLWPSTPRDDEGSET